MMWARSRWVFCRSTADARDRVIESLVLPAPIGPRVNFQSANAGGGVCNGESSQLRRAAEAIGATVVGDAALTLDEIFVSRILG